MTDNLLADSLDDQVQIDETKNYLAELVGEGKKFKTPEDMARGKYESDIYIQIQNKRMDDLRKDYLALRDESMSRANLKEIVDQLSNKQLASSEHTPANEVPTEKPAISSEDIEKIFERKLYESDLSKRQRENFNIVVAKLKERFGANYSTALKPRVEDLRLTDEDVNTLAKKSPEAFFRLMGLDQPAQDDAFQSPPKSSQRPDQFAPKSQKRTWSYWDNLRLTNPTLYYDPKSSEQMVKDAKALGKEFEDGNYNQFP